MNVNEITMSAADLGEVLGVTARRVRQLAEEGVFARAARGEFGLVSCVQAYIARAESRSQPAELLQERIRLTKAQARRLEIENAMSEGTKQNLDAQETITSTMAIHLFARISPMSTWLYGELGEHGVDGSASTIIAGTAHNWLIGARAKVEREMLQVVERSRRRGFPIQDYTDMQRLLGGQVAADEATSE